MGRSAILNVMIRAVQKASESLIHDFREVSHLQVSRKGPKDFVSTADMNADRIIRTELHRARPSYGLITEESGVVVGLDGRHTWIVDPLDGTTNFLHGIPHWAISIALRQDEQIIAGVTYHPIADELYWGERGRGVFLNQQRLRVSGRTHLEDAVMSSSFAFDRVYGGVRRKLIQRVVSVRRSGASTLDLAYIAAGRYDIVWDTGLYPWDKACGILFIQEAGGFSVDVGKTFLATNGILFHTVKDMITESTESVL